MSRRTALDLAAPLPRGRLVVEASAGTGKTYSLAALVVRHVAERGLAASSLLVVTFTRAAAAELRDRARRALVEAVAAVETGTVPPGHPWMSSLLVDDRGELVRRRDHLTAAVAAFDDATITTIHGFCQQTLRQLGLRSGTAIDSAVGDSTAELVEEVCRDLVVTELLDDPTALGWPAKEPPSPAAVLGALRKAVTVVLGNPGAGIVPDLTTAVPAKHDSADRLRRWVDLVLRAVDEVGRRRAARRELGYDDLVTRLRDAIRHPHDGPTVRATLDARYQLVLVDEFQDTDPLQWEIFADAFSGDLITVGDPKQAIYRFRGADVHAYLRATASSPTVDLRTNHRSDVDLVAATNALVVGVHLGDEHIVAAPVAAAAGKPVRALSPGAPISIRRIPDHPTLRNPSGSVSAPLARRAVLDDLVRTVVELLDRHTLDRGDGPERVHPGHIAVLVPSHSAAEQTIRALARAGVPAVRTRTGSVLATSAADEWSLLLAALERPSHAPTVRAAGLGVFLRRRPVDLDPLGEGAEERLAELQAVCAGWAGQLAGQAFLAWYDRVRAESGLVETVLARPGGERVLTDVDHIAELLAAQLGAGGTTAAAARRCLDRLRLEAAEGGIDDDPAMRRIDSDAQAVQVTTLHASKGLQYPIVLLPFSWQGPYSDGPLVYHEPDGRRVVDVATRQDWEDPDPHRSAKGRAFAAEMEVRGDALRLLYVGLTRAQHRTVVWWAPGRDTPKSALSAVLFDRDEDGRPGNTPPTFVVGPRGGVTASVPKISVDEEAAAAHLDALAARHPGLFDIATCDVGATPVRWRRPVDVTAGELTIAAPGSRWVIDPTWRRWSFTAISASRGHTWDADSVGPAVDPPSVGGLDEFESLDPLGATGVDGPSRPTMPWADVLAGAAFGTLVHRVLEHVDPTSTDLEAHLRGEVDRQVRRDRLDVDPEVLVDGLAAAIRTPLGPIGGGRRLADLPVTDRLAELDFDLPLCRTVGRFPTQRIGEVLLDTLAADDVQRPYALELAEGRFGLDLAGYLQGSIDAVLRIPDDTGGHRFVVVDYKTNRLHRRGEGDPLAAYHPDRLPTAMAASDYPLQALLYSVAVHRYLRWRLRGYDPAVHLGGIAYLFVRGMVGADTPTAGDRPFGVAAWTPSAEAVLALDRLFATGQVSDGGTS